MIRSPLLTITGQALWARLSTVLFLAACMASASLRAADDGWEERVNENGLIVETREVPGSSFKAFRASLLVPASRDEVRARLQDVAAYPDWFPDTKEARVLEQFEDGGWANYVRTSVPWPLKDRDAVYVSRLTRFADRDRIDVGTDPDLVPEQRDAVRIQSAGGFWELRDAEGGTLVYWEFHVEPGGKVPSGLANARVVATPRGALEGLKAHFTQESK